MAALALAAFLVFAGNDLATDYLRSHENWGRGLASGIQVQSLQLDMIASEALSGDEGALAAFKQRRDTIATDINSLLEGRAPYSGFRQSPGIADPLRKLADEWTPIGLDAELILRNRDLLRAVARDADAFAHVAMPMQSRMDEVARAMSDAGSAPAQLLLAMREVILIDRMTSAVAEMRIGGPGATLAAAQLARMSAMHESVLKGFLEGDASMGIARLDKPAEKAALSSVVKLDAQARQSLEAMEKHGAQLAEVQSARKELADGSAKVLRDAGDVYAAFDALSMRRFFPSTWWALMSGAMTMFGIVSLALMPKRR